MSDRSDLKSHLKKLHGRLVDVRSGYEQGVKNTQSETVHATFRSIIAMRDRHIAEIDGFLEKMGESPDPDGSWMAPVHEAVMEVRSWFGALGTRVFDSVASGEERILDATAEAAQCAESHPEIRTALVSQHTEIANQIQALKLLDAPQET
jgi:uncharacterized protein (TIGR02284 family)